MVALPRIGCGWVAAIGGHSRENRHRRNLHHEVFAYLRDCSNEAKWQAHLSSQPIVEPSGPARVGRRVVSFGRTPFGEQRFTVEVKEMDEAARSWLDVATEGIGRGSRRS
jgi:hypothetical protein